jgi:hypothetical protein
MTRVAAAGAVKVCAQGLRRRLWPKRRNRRPVQMTVVSAGTSSSMTRGCGCRQLSQIDSGVPPVIPAR